MSKQTFIATVKTEGIANAALYAAACGIPLAVCQLWVRSIK